MTYVLENGVRHVVDDERSDLSGHYEATFSSDGERVERFLTDKGRAELLRLVDAGQRSFTREELDWLTTPPSFDDLLEAMDGEGAEGG